MSADFTVTEISWNRVHLTLIVSLHAAPDAAAPQFAIVTENQSLLVDSVPLPEGRFQLRLNVTNFHDRTQVPDGTWQVAQVTAGEVVDDAGHTVPGWIPRRVAGYDLARLARLDDASRTFIYDGNKVSYSVTFGISEDDDPIFLMRVYQFFRVQPGAGPVAAPSPSARLRSRLLPRSRRLRLANGVYHLARKLRPPTGTRILFASEMRAQMEGNLLRIHDRMVERGLDRKFAIRESFRVPSTATPFSTLRLVYLLATCDIVVIDDYFGVLGVLDVSPKTKIIQAWHAGSGFKSIGYSRFGNYGSPKLSNAHRKYTYAITGSTHLVPVYAEAFGIEEKAVIPTGLPRIDSFLDPERTAKVVADFFAQNPTLKGKKLILFAPTFRGRGISDAHYDYDKVDFDQLYEMCGDEFVVMFRMHHFVDKKVPIPTLYADRLCDFTAFPNANDLLHVTDILVTDYSSIIYEFSLLDRPMLFFAYDRDVYSATRGFHRDFDLAAPGKICLTFDELIKAIQTQDFELEKVAAFRRENFDAIDTNSADRVIDMLILDDPHTSEAASSASKREQEQKSEGAGMRGHLEDGSSDEEGGSVGI